MIYGLVAFGGLVFWLIVGLVALIASAAVDETDYPLKGTFWTFVLLVGAIVAFTSGFPKFDLVQTAIAVAAYLAVGTTWAISRWYFILTKIKRLVNEMTNDGKDSRDIMSSLQSKVNNSIRSFPPRAIDFQDHIWYWLLFWPLDLASKVVTRPLNWIYDRIVNVFSNMRDRILGDISITSNDHRGGGNGTTV